MTDEKYYLAFVGDKKNKFGFTAELLTDPQSINLSMFPKGAAYNIIEIPDDIMSSIDYIEKIYNKNKIPEIRQIITMMFASLHDALLDNKPKEVIYNGIISVEETLIEEFLRGQVQYSQ